MPTELHPCLSFTLCMFVNWEFTWRPLWVPLCLWLLSFFNLFRRSSLDYYPKASSNTSLSFGIFSTSNHLQNNILTTYCSNQSTWFGLVCVTLPNAHATLPVPPVDSWYHLPITKYALWFLILIFFSWPVLLKLWCAHKSHGDAGSKSWAVGQPEIPHF